MYQEFTDLIWTTLEETQTKILDPMGWPPVDDWVYDYLDEWVHKTGLMFCTLKDGGKAVLDPKCIRPEIRLYHLDTCLISIDQSLRPADCNSLVIGIDVKDSKASVVAVGIQPDMNGPPEHVINDGQDYDQGRLRLLHWRRMIEEHLEGAYFDVLDDGAKLAITLTLSQCIELTKDVLATSQDWDFELITD